LQTPCHALIKRGRSHQCGGFDIRFAIAREFS
jgi:hypothetical protein